MRARAFLKGLMPVVLKHPSVTLMLSFVRSVLFFSRVLPNTGDLFRACAVFPSRRFVAVAYDDKCFGCVTCLDNWVWFSTDSASAWTASRNRLA